MELTVKLQVFEEPLDLLFVSARKNKVNIYDIPDCGDHGTVYGVYPGNETTGSGGTQ